MSAGACEGCLVWLLLMCQGFIFLCSRLLTLVRQFVLDPEQVGGVGRVVKLGPHSQQCCCLLCTTGCCSRAWGLIRENQSHIPLPRTLHHAVAQNRW